MRFTRPHHLPYHRISGGGVVGGIGGHYGTSALGGSSPYHRNRGHAPSRTQASFFSSSFLGQRNLYVDPAVRFYFPTFNSGMVWPVVQFVLQLCQPLRTVFELLYDAPPCSSFLYSVIKTSVRQDRSYHTALGQPSSPENKRPACMIDIRLSNHTSALDKSTAESAVVYQR